MLRTFVAVLLRQSGASLLTPAAAAAAVLISHAHEDVLRRILRARSCEAEASFTMWHNLSRWYVPA